MARGHPGARLGRFCLDSKRPPGCSAAILSQLIDGCRWEVVSIPFHEWLPLRSLPQKQAYLREKLKGVLL